MDLPDDYISERRPVFLVPQPGEDRIGWAQKFFRSINPIGTLVRKETGILYACFPGTVPYPILSVEHFISTTDAIYDIQRVQTSFKEGGSRSVTIQLPRPDAVTLFLNPKAQEVLPILDAVVFEPAIVKKGNDFELTPPGYDPVTRIYYHVRSGESPIKPSFSTEHLTKCFSGVPFEDVRYRNNIIAWLLGALIIDPAYTPPMLVVTGNQCNIGKSKTTEACGKILTGDYPAPISSREEEFEKQLSSRFLSNSRFIYFDNIVTKSAKPYSNSHLSSLLTQSWSKSVRILGLSRHVDQKGVLFALTANDCKLENDLAVRSLPIKLYLEFQRSMEPYVYKYAGDFRREIYAELLGLALMPDVPEPDPDTFKEIFPAFRFRTWLSFVLPRVERAFGSLAIDEAIDLEDSVQEFIKFLIEAKRTKPDYTFTSDTIFELLFSTNNASNSMKNYPSIHERIAVNPSDRARKRNLTIFFSSLVGKSLHYEENIVQVHAIDTGDSGVKRHFGCKIIGPDAIGGV